MLALVFDIDDTLYNQAEIFERAYRRIFAKRFPIESEALFVQSRRHGDTVYMLSQCGKMSMEEMYIYRLQKAFAEFSITITSQEALEFQHAYAQEQKNMHLSLLTEDILNYCSERCKLGVITNGPSKHQWQKVAALDLTRWILPEAIFVSGDLGFDKPERRIFDYVREKMCLEDIACWYVGDSWINDIGGASNAGWHTIWLNRRKAIAPKADFAPDVSVHDEKELFETLRCLLG